MVPCKHCSRLLHHNTAISLANDMCIMQYTINLYWGRDLVVDILQNKFSDTFSSTKIKLSWFEFPWSLYLKIQLTINPNRRQAMASNRRQAITWTSDALILWYHMSSIGYNELSVVKSWYKKKPNDITKPLNETLNDLHILISQGIRLPLWLLGWGVAVRLTCIAFSQWYRWIIQIAKLCICIYIYIYMNLILDWLTPLQCLIVFANWMTENHTM